MNILKMIGIFSLTLFVTLFLGCQKSDKSNLLGSDSFDSDRYPNDSNLGNVLGGGGTVSGGSGNGLSLGSGSGGAITQADKDAFNSVLNSADKTAPQTDVPLDPAIAENIRRMLEAESQGQDVSYQKMIIASQILQSCVAKVVEKAPKVGQTLLGLWGGVGQKKGCALNFDVKSAGKDIDGTYAVTGGTQGVLQGNPDGSGDLKASFSGKLTDNPSASGTVSNPGFKFPDEGKEKAAAGNCEVKVTLQQSKNPIPANYTEGMRQFGQCHRQALLLMSPVMGKFFDGLPDSTSSQLQSRLLGIGN